MTHPNKKNAESRYKRWCFRLSSILVSLMPFLLLEAVLALSSLGVSNPTVDPYVGFAEVQPLFEKNSEAGKYVIAAGKRDFFAHDEFPLTKRPGTFRIFCLGGSTVQGNPYSIETSFPTWLRLALQQAAPATQWEVINCGGVSYASYRLSPILTECLNYDPDLFILCSGHNEFLEDRTYQHLKQIPDWIASRSHLILRSRTVQLASQFFDNGSISKPILSPNADAILDYKNGIAAFHRDEDWSAAIARHYEANIQRMVEAAQAADVPLLLLQPLSNLSGTAPFKSESALRSQIDQKRIEELQTRARSFYSTDLSRAIATWEEVCRLDEMCALNWYELGRCLEIQHRSEEALSAFLKARDLDVCPLRMTTPLEEALQRVAAASETPFLNLHELLQSRTATGTLGDNWLVDHVHPSFEGQQQVALEIARWMAQEKILTLPDSWGEDCQLAFDVHFRSLDRAYFHRGRRALRALQLWTQGQTEGPPVEARFPHRFPPQSAPPSPPEG